MQLEPLMANDSENFTWEQRRDAETLVNAEAIKGDPNRMKAAQDYIALSAHANMKALGLNPSRPAPGKHTNKATIAKLNHI